MAPNQDIDAVLQEVKTLIEQLLAAPPSPSSDIPTSQGVYLIYDKGGKVIYVGKGKNLNRRVFADHLGGDLKMSTSTFRRSVNRVYGISPGQPLREWVRSNCSFAFVAIPDPDLCSAVEALAVLVLRQQGFKLFNA
jgi:AraC-like DNA-binding protein